MDRIVRIKSTRELDWTKLHDDTVIHLFSCLNYRDRASLSSTCKTWWILSKSPFLWQELDLRFYKCDAQSTNSLASRCANLKKLRFRGNESADAIINLRASNVREISGYACRKLTDSSLSVLAARYEALECLHIDLCHNISGDAIRAIALCCPKLKKLWLTGVRNVSREAIHALANNCRNLTDIGFIECLMVDVIALGDVKTLHFLSLAGTSNIDWNLALLHWSKLLNLTCLDLSSTNVNPRAVAGFLASCFKLKVLCVLNCPSVEHAATSMNHSGKVLVAFFTDILKELATLFIDMKKEIGNVFLGLRNPDSTNGRNLDGILDWLEWSVCHSLLLFTRKQQPGIDNFWLHQGTILLLSFLQSPHQEVQERAATALASFVLIGKEHVDIEVKRAEGVVRQGGIRFITNLACSWQEGLQLVAIKAIQKLLVNNNVAKVVVDDGGASVLINIARSASKMVAEKAVAGLWDLCTCAGDGQKAAIAKAGGIRVLVEFIIKWSKANAGEPVMKPAAGALADLALDDKCSREVASLGGVHVLVRLLRTGIDEGVQEQAARCLGNMAYHGNSNDAGLEKQHLEALVQLILSHHDGVREETARALWNLSLHEGNREAIAAIGGVQALIALANSCSSDSLSLQQYAAGALWGLSDTEENSIAIGQEGGVTPLIALAKSSAEEVHQIAVAALMNLAYNSVNAMRIIQEGGVPTLVHLCSFSVSMMARFISMLTLAFMFDAGLDELAVVGTSNESTSKITRLKTVRRVASKAIKEFLKSYSDPRAFSVAASSSSATEALTHLSEPVCIEDVDFIQCSGLEIGRLVNMLGHRSAILKSCGAFALLQFTMPGGQHSLHHANLLQNVDAQKMLRKAATSSATASQGAKGFAQAVLKNLEYHHVDTSS